jgi:hypothetical protein
MRGPRGMPTECARPGCRCAVPGRVAGAGRRAGSARCWRDPQLDSVLRQRGRELGIAEDSRLARVMQSQEIDRVLMRELGHEVKYDQGGDSDRQQGQDKFGSFWGLYSR